MNGADGAVKMQSDRWAAPLCVAAAGSVFAASICLLVFSGRSKGSEPAVDDTPSQPAQVITITQNTPAGQPTVLQPVDR
jgi:hypothetical protein